MQIQDITYRIIQCCHQHEEPADDDRYKAKWKNHGWPHFWKTDKNGGNNKFIDSYLMHCAINSTIIIGYIYGYVYNWLAAYPMMFQSDVSQIIVNCLLLF
jgi:hypothetical protein